MAARCLCLLIVMLSLAVRAQEVQPAAYDARPAAAATSEPTEVRIDELGKRFRLVGKLGIPLGDIAKVQGIVVNSRAKGYDAGIGVRIYRVNGQATQEFIQIKLNDYYGRDEIPNLEPGKSYEFSGFETGGFVGVPAAAMKQAGVVSQASNYAFLHEFITFDQQEIQLQPFSPADFVGREALIQGLASNEGGSAYIAAGNWRLLVDNGTPWPRASEGKVVEVRGVIRTLGNKTGTYRLDQGGKAANARLVQLADQLNKPAVLRGTLTIKNNQPVFTYRGSQVYLEDAARLVAKLEAGVTAVEATGRLEEGPVQTGALDTLSGEKIVHRGYILRKATLKPASPLLAVERAEPVE
jgi:hypothetical protein